MSLVKDKKVEEGLVVSTIEQTAGRGQRGNHWIASPGENLTFSFFMQPTFLQPTEQFELNVFLSLAIVDYLESKGVKEVAVKWPNDIYVGEKKISGVLIENGIKNNRIEYSVAGIGLNVNQMTFGDYAATSLTQILGNKLDVNQEFNHLLSCLDEKYRAFKKTPSLRTAYTRKLFRYGEECFFYDTYGEKFKGVILGVNELGQLAIQKGKLINYYDFQQVKMVL